MMQTANKFESTNAELQRALNTLMNLLEPIQAAWVGAGGSSFQSVKQAYHQDQINISNALTETAEAIRTSGANYTSTDNTQSSAVSGSYSHQNYPL